MIREFFQKARPTDCVYVYPCLHPTKTIEASCRCTLLEHEDEIEDQRRYVLEGRFAEDVMMTRFTPPTHIQPASLPPPESVSTKLRPPSTITSYLEWTVSKRLKTPRHSNVTPDAFTRPTVLYSSSSSESHHQHSQRPVPPSAATIRRFPVKLNKSTTLHGWRPRNVSILANPYRLRYSSSFDRWKILDLRRLLSVRLRSDRRTIHIHLNNVDESVIVFRAGTPSDASRAVSILHAILDYVRATAAAVSIPSSPQVPATPSLRIRRHRRRVGTTTKVSSPPQQHRRRLTWTSVSTPTKTKSRMSKVLGPNLTTLLMDTSSIVRDEDESRPLRVGPFRSRYTHQEHLAQIIEIDLNSFIIIWKHCPHTLQSVLRYVPEALSSLARRRFLLYQLLVAVRTAHEHGVFWGGSLLCPQICMLTEHLWLRLRLPIMIPRSVESLDRRSATEKWIVGDISNFEYLLCVNAAAGRIAGPSANLHPILPWVHNFVNLEKGYRNLRRTKFRLTKGDDMLKYMYDSIGHHVTEFPLSDFEYYMYLARVTPLRVLRHHVRGVFQAKEYASSMRALYASSPVECIPEFFTDPAVLKASRSIPKIQVPKWCSSPEDFIKWHRRVLESDRVSVGLHHWIDLIFGYKLSGQAAINAMNVPLKVVRVTNQDDQLFTAKTRRIVEDDEKDGTNPLLRDDTRALRTKCLGFVQLFDRPHPSRGSETSTDSIERMWAFDSSILSSKANVLPSSSPHSENNQQSRETLQEQHSREEQQQQTTTKIDNKTFDLCTHTKRFQHVRRQLVFTRKRLETILKHLSKPVISTNQDQEDVSLPDNIPESIRAAAASLVAASVAMMSSNHASHIAKQCHEIPKHVTRIRDLQDEMNDLKREANEAQTTFVETTTSNTSSPSLSLPPPPTSSTTTNQQQHQDIVATGIIALELLTGRRYQNDALKNLPTDIAETISYLLQPSITEHAIQDALRSPLLRDLSSLYELVSALENPKCTYDRFEILQHRIQLCTRALDRTSIEGIYSTSVSCSTSSFPSSSSSVGLLCRVSDEELSIVLPYILRLFECPNAPIAKSLKDNLEKKQEASGPQAYAQSKATKETVEMECRALSITLSKLFDPLARRLGPKACRALLIEPIKRLWTFVSKHEKSFPESVVSLADVLLSPRFQHLCIRHFGVQDYMEHVSKFLIRHLDSVTDDEIAAAVALAAVSRPRSSGGIGAASVRRLLLPNLLARMERDDLARNSPAWAAATAAVFHVIEQEELEIDDMDDEFDEDRSDEDGDIVLSKETGEHGEYEDTVSAIVRSKTTEVLDMTGIETIKTTTTTKTSQPVEETVMSKTLGAIGALTSDLWDLAGGGLLPSSTPAKQRKRNRKNTFSAVSKLRTFSSARMSTSSSTTSDPRPSSSSTLQNVLVPILARRLSKLGNQGAAVRTLTSSWRASILDALQLLGLVLPLLPPDSVLTHLIAPNEHSTLRVSRSANSSFSTQKNRAISIVLSLQDLLWILPLPDGSRLYTSDDLESSSPIRNMHGARQKFYKRAKELCQNVGLEGGYMVVKADLVNEFGESMYDSSKWYVRKLLTKASKGKREEKDDDDDDDDDGEEETKPISTDDFRRVGHVHRQLAHIMVTCCYKIGSKSTREYVLPILGQYFDCWSDAFGVAVEGSTEAALALSLFEGITRPLGDLLGNGIVQQLSNTTRVLWQRLARADVGSDSSNSKCWRWWWNKEVERKILEEEADKPKNKKRHGSAENEDDDEDESPLTWLEDEIDCIDPTVRSIFSQHTTDCTDDEKQRWTGPSRRFGIQAKRVATLASEAMHMRKPIAQSPRARTMIDQIVHKRPQNDTTVHLLLRGDFETCAERGRKRALAATQAALKSINHLGDETDEKVAEKSSSSSDDMDPPLLHRDETSILAHSEAVTALASRDSLLVSGGANGAVKIWQVRERLDKVVLETASLLPMRHSRPISSIHLVKSGLLTVCDGSIHIWDAERRTKLEEVRMPSRRSRFVSTTSNGQSLAAATSSGTICVLDLRVSNRYRQWDTHTRTSVVAEYTCSDLTAESKVPQITSTCYGEGWIAAGTRDGHISQFDMRMGVLIRSWMSTDRKQITSVGALRPGPSPSDSLLSVCADGTVCLWDVNRSCSKDLMKKPRRIFRAGNMCPGKTPSASMSALRRSVCTRRDERTDSLYVYSAVADRMATIRVSRNLDSERAWRFRLQHGDVQSMALIPGSETIAFGTNSGAIRLWD